MAAGGEVGFYLPLLNLPEFKYNPFALRGRGQVVRHQPSKLIFAGPNPVARLK
jgi:hypothetical protein